MNIIPQKLEGVLLIEPDIFQDERGFFMESFHQQKFEHAGLKETFVQDNHSRSSKGVIRGLHYQQAPHGQGKLVRVTSGAIFDVAIDINKNSSTFGQWVGVELSAVNQCLFYIPPHMAHGFCALEDHTDVLYKVTTYYNKAADAGIKWNDPDIGIEWPKLDSGYLVSEKDQNLPLLKVL